MRPTFTLDPMPLSDFATPMILLLLYMHVSSIASQVAVRENYLHCLYNVCVCVRACVCACVCVCVRVCVCPLSVQCMQYLHIMCALSDAMWRHTVCVCVHCLYSACSTYTLCVH